jgi:glycosyltransferase involved in cell wall biosynthesis
VTNQKIALLSSSLGGGGAERVISILANGFQSAGFIVDVVVLQAGGEFESDLHESIRLVDLRAPRASGAIRSLSAYFREARPDVVLSTQAHVNTLAILARLHSRISTTLIVRESNTPVATARLARSFRSYTMLLAARAAYTLADYIVAPSEGVRDELIRTLRFRARRVRRINNPLPLSVIHARAREHIDHPWFSSGSIPVIVAIGRLSTQKDFDTVLEALVLVRQHREARLVILGEGGERERLERRIGELGLTAHVSMPGFVANPFAYLARSSVYVLSSPSEGMPNTLLEAMAVGVPVVATDCPSGPREMLRGGRWGRLVAVGSAVQMADGILAALDGRLGAPTKEELAAEYGVEQIIQQYAVLSQSVSRAPEHATAS